MGVKSPREGGQAGFSCRRNPAKYDSSEEETRDSLNSSHTIFKNTANEWDVETLD